MPKRPIFIWGAALAIALPSTGADAQETTTYTYDALGRLVAVTKSGGPSSGLQASYTYDHAGNRTNVTVTNAPNGGGGDNGSGASVPDQPLYVVVPLNGYTLIRVR
jgi:YD repeat-containing protein